MGTSLIASPWRAFPYQIHVCNFHNGSFACVVDNIINEFFSQISGASRCYPFFETICLTIPFSFYHGDQTTLRTSWRVCCICRSISIQYVRIERPRKLFNLDQNPWRWACRSTQVKIYTGLIAWNDLLPQEKFTFFGILALVVSESSFGAYICHSRTAGAPVRLAALVGVYFRATTSSNFCPRLTIFHCEAHHFVLVLSARTVNFV